MNTHAHKHTHTHKNLTVSVQSQLFMITKKWKQFKCASTDKWINKMWYSHTKKYYLAIKRNEVLIHATTWSNL